jgi:DNA-binding transcriptional MerR regulator
MDVTGVGIEATGVGLTVSAVARRMGVAPATLRTWDRRYGLGPGLHAAGSHRRYSAEDLARLEHMRRLVNAGVPAADAARVARELPVEELATAPVARPDPADAPPRPGGGRILRQPGASPAERGLARAAQSLDTAACQAIIAESVQARGVIWTWDHLLVPVLTAVGSQWESSGRGIEVEHALSSATQHALAGVTRPVATPVNSRAIILTCAPGEMHSLPLWALGAALSERRIGARILGAGLPYASLQRAVDRLGPIVVFIWSQIPGTPPVTGLEDLPAGRPRREVLVGGPGWSGPLPDGVLPVGDLASAVTRIAHIIGE